MLDMTPDGNPTNADEGESDRIRHSRSNGLLAMMVFLVALNLRPSIVAVGPLLESLGRDLHWEESAQGLLGAVPLLAFAAMSSLVRFLAGRLGENATVLSALLGIAIGAVIRSAGGSALVWIGTAIIGCAIAVGNVLVPAIVRRDFVRHVSVATAVSSGCITAGSATASLTVAAMAEHWGGWRPALAFWAVPALVVAVLWGVRMVEKHHVNSLANADCSSSEAQGSAADATSLKPARDESNVVRPSIPLWRRPMTWWVTAFMGLQSAAFYTMSNWLPTIAGNAGFDMTASSRQLFVFQVIGVFAGLLIPRLMNERGNQITAALTASLPMVVAGLGWLLMPRLSMLWAVIGGCGQGAALVVALALITMRGRTQAETVVLSGIAQSLGYLLASLGPSVFGFLAEHTSGLSVPLTFFTVLASIQCVVSFRVGRSERGTVR